MRQKGSWDSVIFLGGYFADVTAVIAIIHRLRQGTKNSLEFGSLKKAEIGQETIGRHPNLFSPASRMYPVGCLAYATHDHGEMRMRLPIRQRPLSLQTKPHDVGNVAIHGASNARSCSLSGQGLASFWKAYGRGAEQILRIDG